MSQPASPGDLRKRTASTLAVDRDADVPIGVQLAWALRTRIGDGEFAPGQRLPGLRELAEAIGVNLNTVRAVYQRLEQEGLIESQQGSGTFVAADARSALRRSARSRPTPRATARETGVDPREVAAALYVAPETPAAEQHRRASSPRSGSADAAAQADRGVRAGARRARSRATRASRPAGRAAGRSASVRRCSAPRSSSSVRADARPPPGGRAGGDRRAGRAPSSSAATPARSAQGRGRGRAAEATQAAREGRPAPASERARAPGEHVSRRPMRELASAPIDEQRRAATRLLTLKRVGMAAATAFVDGEHLDGLPAARRVWIGSQAVGSARRSAWALWASSSIVLAVLVVRDGAAAYVAEQRLRRASTGRERVERRSTWLRSMRAESERHVSQRVGITALERIVMVNVYVAVITLVVWYVFFASAPAPTLCTLHC